MPFVRRAAKPTLHYCLDDFTDPWRSAQTVVLQHGFGRSSGNWYAWVPYLSRFYRVVRPDLRGLGQSSTDFDLADGISVDAYIADLRDLIREVGRGRPVHFCGESLGGMLGIVLAAEHPELVETLSLVAAPLYISDEIKEKHAAGHASWQDALATLGARGWADALNTVTRFPADADPGLLHWYSDQFGRSDVNVLVAMSRVASSLDVRPFLSRVRTPVLGLYPSASAVAAGHEDVLQARLADFRLVRLPTRSHMISNLAPAACATEVLHFIGQHDGVSCHE